MMEFLVRLGWRAEFSFDDLSEAANFAKTAFRTRSGDESGNEIQIIIREVEIFNKENEVNEEVAADETDNV